MKINKALSDDVILTELGTRLQDHRLELQLTQAELADRAGIGKRTLERIEGGQSAQMSSLLRVFRALGLLSSLDGLLPEPRPRPMALLKSQGKPRQRASGRGAKGTPNENWQWGEDH